MYMTFINKFYAKFTNAGITHICIPKSVCIYDVLLLRH